MKDAGEEHVTCLIADDEKSGRDLIKKHIARIPFLRVVHECKTAYEALVKIPELRPDVVFLDIQMPGMTGFELLSALGKFYPTIIIVSGNPEFALSGFDHQVTDFLLKPVTFERFSKAVAKALREGNYHSPAINSQVHETTNHVSEHARLSVNDYLLVKGKKQLIRVDLKDLHMVEAMKDYLKIYEKNNTHVIHETMTTIESALPYPPFMRVHRSFIINHSIITGIEGHIITTTIARSVPIGNTYRSTVLESLRKQIMG